MITIREITPRKLSGVSSFLVSFPYNPELVELIKTFQPAIYDKKEKTWEIASNHIGKLLETLTFYDEIEFTIKPEKKAAVEDPLYGPLTEEEISQFRVRPYEHQIEGINFLLAQKKSLLLDNMGLGKLEPLDSLIPTPAGFARMGDLGPGDKVFGSDGKPHTILRVYPHKNKDIYKVTFSDGATRLCGADHLWQVRTPLMRARKKGWTVKSTKELLEAGLHPKGHPAHNKWEIPMTAAVEYPEKEYFIHPYILGVMLGDGCLCHSTPYISISDQDIDTPDRLRGYLQAGYELHRKCSAGESCPKYGIVNSLNCQFKGGLQQNGYIAEIRRLDINVKSGDKFIPEEYKLGSVQQRLDLLRGLMDTDGSINQKNRIAFDSTSEKLANDVAEIARSLGMVARVSTYHRTRPGTNEGYDTYRVRLNPTVNPFYLERKAAKYTKTTAKYLSRYIANIEYAGKSDAQCIMVDSDDHCYLTGREYIVTHNTNEMIWYAETLKRRRLIDHCLVICGVNSVKLNFAKEINKFSTESVRILGQKVNSKGTVSYATLPKRAEELRGHIDEFFVVTNIETIRSDQIVDAIMHGKNNFGLICLDEAHKCLRGNTVVNTDIGKLAIEEIVTKNINCNIYSYNFETCSYEYKPILSTSSSEHLDDKYELTFVDENSNTKTIVCSAGHMIYTTNRGYVPAALLEEVDEIVGE